MPSGNDDKMSKFRKGTSRSWSGNTFLDKLDDISKRGSAATLKTFGDVVGAILPEPVLRASTFLSPLNYLAALSHGTLDPRVGELEIATWDPRLQLLGRVGEMATGPKAVKGAVNKAAPYIKSTTANATSTVKAYKNVIPLMVNKAKNFDGSSKISRGITNIAHVFFHPSMVKTLNSSPELILHFPIYSFRDFTPRQMAKFLKVWSEEAARGPYSRNGMLLYSVYPEDVLKLSQTFENARDLYNVELIGQRYGRMLGNRYHKMYESITDPDLRHIVDTSPLYMEEVYNYHINPGDISKEAFIQDLINRSNSYRRYMSFDATPELFSTFNGRGLVKTNGALINVEGPIRSDFAGEYGSYPGYYLGKPEITGPVNTWWDLRMPKGVDITEGIHSVQPYSIKFSRLGDKHPKVEVGLSPLRKLVEGYLSTGAPWKFFSYPAHLIFSGPKGSILPNFLVTTGTPPIGFKFGKGYKQGGKIN